MTEDEAKTKYCPLKPLNKDVNNTCIASECMWWVWESKYSTENPSIQLKSTSGHCGAIK